MPAELECSKRAEKLVKELSASVDIYKSRWNELKDLPATKEILASDLATKRAVVAFTVETILAIWENWEKPELWQDLWFGKMIKSRVLPRAAMEVSRQLLQRNLGYTEPELASLFKNTSKIRNLSTSEPFLEPLVKTLEGFAAANIVSSTLAAAAKQLSQAICWNNAPERKLRERTERLSNSGPVTDESAQVRPSEDNYTPELQAQAS